MAKQKAQYPEDFKTMFGVSTMSLTQVISGALTTGYLMLYVTDYSGLYTGIAGKAAAVATLMMLLGRIWDAVNDPLLGFLMDRSPRTKWGRFKPFIFLFTPISTLLLIGLFNIPAGVSDAAKIALLYVLYFLYDSAFTLLPVTPLTQSLSNDARVRAKLTAAPRVVSLILSMTTSFFIAIAIGLGKDGVTPNIGLAVIVFILPVTILSMLGVALVKEGKNNTDEAKVTLKDFLALLKTNRPMWIYLISSLFGGFVWTFLFAAQAYYIKYAFGVENFGTQTAIFGLLIIVSMILGAFVSQWVLKIKKVTPAISFVISYGICIVPLAILWLINLAGPITNVVLFYPLMFLSMLGVGMSFVPGRLINMETMDYNKDINGKSMEGTLAALSLFIEKIQTAIAAALTGVILIAVGYNAELYKDATTIPDSLFTGLGLVMFGIPALLALIAVVMMFFYPLLKKSRRDAMYAEIEARKLAMAASTAGPSE
jgi:Na+/melibiose symporter-like transporter